MCVCVCYLRILWDCSYPASLHKRIKRLTNTRGVPLQVMIKGIALSPTVKCQTEFRVISNTRGTAEVTLSLRLQRLHCTVRLYVPEVAVGLFCSSRLQTKPCLPLAPVMDYTMPTVPHSPRPSLVLLLGTDLDHI